MDNVNEIVLESAVVILSGGVDKSGTALITFPVDSADLLDIYSVGDILRLLQVFVDLCKGQVAVVVDLKHGWTEECIAKLTYLLDELQMSRNGSLKAVYLVKPCVKTKKRHLHRQLSRVTERGRAVPHYEIKKVENLEELYNWIEKSQLTVDYGGSMQYNHLAWVDFQRTFIPVILEIKGALDILPTIKDELCRLCCKEISSFENNQQKELLKYQSFLNRYKIRESLSNCQDAIERLEHPECDPNLIKTHSAVLADTVSQLKALHQRLADDLYNMDAIMSRSDTEHAIFIKLEECNENTTEVEETIELMVQQMKDLPTVGDSEEVAHEYRNRFIQCILLPSKDIVSCATSILNDLDCGKDTTPKSYAFAIEIAKRLTDSLQPFTQHLNELNEKYTRIHLFHVLLNKTSRWKQKAIKFLIKILCVKNKIHSTRRERTVKKNKTNETNNNKGERDERQNNELHIDLDDVKNDKEVSDYNRVVAPSGWESLLQTFYKKHPPPKKKHIRLLNRYVPDFIHEKQRNEADMLAERVLFILQKMKTAVFKTEDIVLVQAWSNQYNRNSSIVFIDEITLV